MATSCGDVSFRLMGGDVDVADYDAQKSPFGFHIIKRIR